MAIGDWSARRLARVWLVGLGLQAALIASLWAYNRATEPPEARAARLTLQRNVRAMDAYEDSVRRGLRPPAPDFTPAQKAQLRAVLRDSLGITWETRGKETTVHLPPAMEQGLKHGVDAFGRGLVVTMILAAIVQLSIPLSLIAITVAWLVARGGSRRQSSITPAA